VKRIALAAALLGAVGSITIHAQQAGAPDEQIVQRAVHVCDTCHGEGGRSAKGAFPNLAGQMPQYTVAQLKAFREQKRSEIDPQAYMWGVSALLDDSTIQGLADHFAAQPPAPGVPGPGLNMAAGKRIYERGIPARGVRPCASCHGDHGEGASVFPRLAGQQAAYVLRQLTLFGTKLRPHAVLMKNESAKLTPAEKRAVADYVQSL